MQSKNSIFLIPLSCYSAASFAPPIHKRSEPSINKYYFKELSLRVTLTSVEVVQGTPTPLTFEHVELDSADPKVEGVIEQSTFTVQKNVEGGKDCIHFLMPNSDPDMHLKSFTFENIKLGQVFVEVSIN